MNDDKQPVDEERVYQVAAWLAKKDGVEEDDLHRLIWEGNPPEPWGEVWNRYEDDARELLAMLAASPAHTESAAPVDEHGLLPCPFCNGTPELKKTAYGMPVMKWVACKSCEASATAYETAASAYASWNQRTADPAPSPVSGADERAAFGEWKKGWWFADGGHSDTEVCSYADTDSAAESAFMAGWEASRAALAPTPNGKQADEALCDHEWEPITTPHKECTKCGEVRIDPTGQQALSTKDS